MTAPAASPRVGSPGFATPASDANTTVVLDLNQVNELFDAPDCNPFSAHQVAILGRSGIELLRWHFRRRWPGHAGLQTVVIRLPATLQPPTPAEHAALEHTVQAAIANYCTERVQARRTELKVSFVNARRELLIALAVTLVAIALLALTIGGYVLPWLTNLQYFATLMAVFAASLAIWDALESLFFDWVPYIVENGADRWIAGLAVQLTYAPAEAAGSATPLLAP